MKCCCVDDGAQCSEDAVGLNFIGHAVCQHHADMCEDVRRLFLLRIAEGGPEVRAWLEASDPEFMRGLYHEPAA